MITEEKNERNPMADAAAGEIASIVHNESKGGKVLGFDRVSKDIDSDVETSEGGIILGKKSNYPSKVLEFFQAWLSNSEKCNSEPLFDYVVDVFQIIFLKTGRPDGKGTIHYMKEVFPIMKIVKCPSAVGAAASHLTEGMIVKGPNELSQFGENPEWYQWEEGRQSNDSTQTKNLAIEPPFYIGTISMWADTYGAGENVLHTNNVHNSRFLVPLNEIKSVLKADYIVENYKKLIDELEKTKS